MYRLFRKPDFGEGQHTFRSHILFTVIWLTVIVVSLVEAFYLILLPAYFIRWLSILAAVILVSFCMLLLNWIGKTTLASVILLSSYWWVVIYVAMTDGGISSSAVPAMIVLAVYSGYLLGRRGLFISCVAYLLTGAGLVVLEAMKLLPAPYVNASLKESIFVTYLFYLLMVIVVQNRHDDLLSKTLYRVDTEKQERLQSEQALLESRGLTKDLLETANVMVLIFDRQGRLEVFNRTAEKISGYTKSELVSRNWVDVLIPSPRFMVESRQVKSLFEHGCPRGFESPILTKSGSICHIAWQCNEITNSQARSQIRIAFGMDITGRKQHEMEQQAIASISSALRVAQNRIDLQHMVMSEIHQFFHTAFTAMAVVDENNRLVIDTLDGRQMEDTFDEIFTKNGILNTAISINEIYLNNSLQNHPVVEQYQNLAEMQALLCLPLFAHGTRFGSLILMGEEPFSESEVHTLSMIADNIAGTIHRIASYEQMKNSVQRLAALYKLDMAISGNFDLPDLFDTVLDQVVDQFHVDAADILLLTPDGLDFIYSSGKGFQSDAIQMSRRRVGESLAGTAVLTKSIIYIVNYPLSDEDTDMREIMLQENITSYYAVPLVAKNVVKGVLEIFLRSHMPPRAEWLDFLQMLGSITAISIDDAQLFRNLQQANIELTNAYEATIEGWSHALDLRDKETEGHTRRVTELTEKLARRMGLEGEGLAHLRRGALLHDIGKMGVPDSILLKPGSLTDEEWDIMKLHPHYAYNMLSSVHYLAKAVDIPYCHHEKWDGTGYPRGLKGEQIPLAARIFSVVDVWDAVTSDRPYRDAWPAEKALQHIRASSGTQFDPQVVQVFVEMMDKNIT